MITQYYTATSGTFTASNTQQDALMIHEAGSLSLSMTFSFPSNPVDCQMVTMLSTGGITVLTLSAIVGTIVNAITGMTAGTPATYIYYSATNKWYRYK